MPRKRPKKLPTGIRWKDGSYRAIYRDPEGRQVEEATGQNLEEAVAHRRRQMKAVREGTWQPREERRALTLAAAFERWLPTRRKKIRSADAEAKWIRKYALPSLGDVPLEELRPKTIARWVEELQDVHGLAARSVRNAHGALSALLTWAVFEEHILRNPAAGLPRGILPRIGRSKRPAFTRAQVLELLTCEAIPEDRRALYATAAMAGLRTGEVAGRRWRDLEEREGLRALRVATQYDDRPLKGAKGEDTAERVVPLHPELDELLRWWWVRWEAHFGRVPTGDDWILPRRFDQLGKPRTQNQISKALRRDLDRAGVEHAEGLGMHSFRRWFASAAQAGGADKATVREITHRPKGDVLEDSYTRRSWETLCAAVLAVGLRLDDGADVVPMRAAAGANAGENAGGFSEATESPLETGVPWWRRGESKPAPGGQAERSRQDRSTAPMAELADFAEESGAPTPDVAPVLATASTSAAGFLGTTRLHCAECGAPSAVLRSTCSVCGVAFLRPPAPALGAEEEDHG